MELLNHLNTIIANGVATLYESMHISFADMLPAQIDQYIDASRSVSGVRTVLVEISFVASIIFAVLLVWGAVKRRALVAATSAVVDSTSTVDTQTPVASSAGALRGRWSEIMTHLDSPRENDWKQAVVEADKLVDMGLMKAGFPGDTFGDRLTNIQAGMLTSLDGVWWAHRLRNRVAHELDYFLRYTEARQAISYYQAALEELHLI